MRLATLRWCAVLHQTYLQPPMCTTNATARGGFHGGTVATATAVGWCRHGGTRLPSTLASARRTLPTLAGPLHSLQSDSSQGEPWNERSVPSVVDDTDTAEDAAATLARQRTLQWVRGVVVGLNLCPFAEKPLLQNRLRLVVVATNHDKEVDDDSDLTVPSNVATQITATMRISKDRMEETVRTTVELEGERLLTTPGTTLVVCPDCYPHDFESFMDLVQAVERMISKRDWDGILQVAPFHPHFQFAGSDSPTEPDNRTNQSPYPMIHILREDEVSHAVEQLPDQDAAVVWSRNVDLLNELASVLDPVDFDAVLTTGLSSWSTRATDESVTVQDNSNSALDTTESNKTVRSTVRRILGRFRIPLLPKSRSVDAIDDSMTS